MHCWRQVQPTGDQRSYLGLGARSSNPSNSHHHDTNALSQHPLALSRLLFCLERNGLCCYTESVTEVPSRLGAAETPDTNPHPALHGDAFHHYIAARSHVPAASRQLRPTRTPYVRDNDWMGGLQVGPMMTPNGTGFPIMGDSSCDYLQLQVSCYLRLLPPKAPISHSVLHRIPLLTTRARDLAYCWFCRRTVTLLRWSVRALQAGAQILLGRTDVVTSDFLYDGAVRVCLTSRKQLEMTILLSRLLVFQDCAP